MTVQASTVTTRTVRHVARPMGKASENGPHLSDLREFVRLSGELPDDVVVRIDKGRLNEGGRCDVTFEATHRVQHEQSVQELEQELQRSADLVAELRRQLDAALKHAERSAAKAKRADS